MSKDFDYYLDLMRSNVSDLDTSEGGVVDGIFRSVAFALAAVQQDLQGFAAIAFPEDGSGAYLDARAADVGLTRKPGGTALAYVTFAGEYGVKIPIGTVVQTAGGLAFRTLQNGTLAGSGINVPVAAIDVGEKYNVAENEITTMQTATMATVRASSAASGGSDPETDAALLQRLRSYLRQTPASCNTAQYIAWATSVDGVGYAKVIPRPNNTPYAVKLALVDEEMQPVSPEKAAEVAAQIETLREVNVTVTVEPASACEISVSASITPAEGVTAAEVQKALAESMAAYFRELTRTGGSVIYKKIEFLLLSVPGVEDLSSLLVNEDTSNISLGTDEVPVVGTVTITA